MSKNKTKIVCKQKKITQKLKLNNNFLQKKKKNKKS